MLHNLLLDHFCDSASYDPSRYRILLYMFWSYVVSCYIYICDLSLLVQSSIRYKAARLDFSTDR